MLDDDYNRKFRQFETMYETKTTGLSPADLSQKWLDDFFIRLSTPLKRMQADYLTNVTKNCYKEKHISDDFTNLEQIMLCKEIQRQQIFGNFDRMYVNHRDSGIFYCH